MQIAIDEKKSIEMDAFEVLEKTHEIKSQKRQAAGLDPRGFTFIMPFHFAKQRQRQKQRDPKRRDHRQFPQRIIIGSGILLKIKQDYHGERSDDGGENRQRKTPECASSVL